VRRAVAWVAWRNGYVIPPPRSGWTIKASPVAVIAGPFLFVPPAERPLLTAAGRGSAPTGVRRI